MPFRDKVVIRPAPSFTQMIMLLDQLDKYVNRVRLIEHDETKANYRVFGVVRSLRGEAPEPEFSWMLGYEVMPAPYAATTYAAREIVSSEEYKEHLERYSAERIKVMDVWENAPRKWEGMIAVREHGMRFVPHLHFNVTAEKDLELRDSLNVIDKKMEQDVARIIENTLNVIVYEDFARPKPKESYKIPMSRNGRLY